MSPIILRLPEVLARTGYKRSTIYDLQSKGLFPHAIKLGVKAVGWPEHEITQWIEQRIAASRPQAASSQK